MTHKNKRNETTVQNEDTLNSEVTRRDFLKTSALVGGAIAVGGSLSANTANYFEELDAAYALVRERDGHDNVLVTAHSTGGLVAPLWADARRPALAGMVLNSPWLDLHGSFLLRTAGTAAIDQVGARRPYLAIPRNVSGLYAQSLHREHRGEWDFDLTLKPHEGFPARAGFIRSVTERWMSTLTMPANGARISTIGLPNKSYNTPSRPPSAIA